MRTAVEILIKLIPSLFSRTNMEQIAAKALELVGELLGTDSTAYRLISVVVTHCIKHNCLSELRDALLEMLSFSEQPNSFGYSVSYSESLQPIAGELDEMRSMVQSA